MKCRDYFYFGMIICVIAGYGPSKIAEVFIEACSELWFVMVVGLARSILVIMQDGNIDSVYGLYQPLKIYRAGRVHRECWLSRT